MSNAAVERLVHLSFRDAERAFVDACAEVSGGNPFLLGALLRSLRGVATGAGDEGARIPGHVPMLCRDIPTPLGPGVPGTGQMPLIIAFPGIR